MATFSNNTDIAKSGQSSKQTSNDSLHQNYYKCKTNDISSRWTTV